MPKSQTIEDERLFGLKKCKVRVYQKIIDQVSKVPTDGTPPAAPLLKDTLRCGRCKIHTHRPNELSRWAE